MDQKLTYLFEARQTIEGIESWNEIKRVEEVKGKIPFQAGKIISGVRLGTECRFKQNGRQACPVFYAAHGELEIESSTFEDEVKSILEQVIEATFPEKLDFLSISKMDGFTVLQKLTWFRGELDSKNYQTQDFRIVPEGDRMYELFKEYFI